MGQQSANMQTTPDLLVSVTDPYVPNENSPSWTLYYPNHKINLADKAVIVARARIINNTAEPSVHVGRAFSLRLLSIELEGSL